MRVFIPAAAGLVTIFTGFAKLYLMGRKGELPWQKEGERWR